MDNLQKLDVRSDFAFFHPSKVTTFYDRDIGNLISCKVFYDGNRISGTDLYIQKITVQRTTKIVMDQNELLIKWADKELIKGFYLNDFIDVGDK